MHRLQVITASTRPARVGPKIADWFLGVARRDASFEIEAIDLAEMGLPLFNEPRHPRLRQYEHEHTRRWGETIARADAYVFVMPEYNHMPAPSLVNAIDFLVHEWAYKPAGFVSYGGAAAGARAVQALKPMLVALKVMPMFESVMVPFFPKFIGEDGIFRPEPALEEAAVVMLRELQRWADALKVLRA